MRVLRRLLTLLVLSGLFWGAWLLWPDADYWWFSRSYEPPARIVQLADQSKMSLQGRRIFYRTSPQIISSRQELSTYCGNKDAEIIELGCFITTNKIYLLDIKQPDLRVQMISVAAHEMLHGAWQRLSQAERRQVEMMLNQALKQNSDDDIRKEIALYKGLEPDQLSNEIHSILATELATLPPDLELYYKKYFIDRSAVVSATKQYNSIFSTLKNQIDELKNKIDSLKNQMDFYERTGRISAYNQLVPQVNELVVEHNAKVALYNSYSYELQKSY